VVDIFQLSPTSEGTAKSTRAKAEITHHRMILECDGDTDLPLFNSLQHLAKARSDLITTIRFWYLDSLSHATCLALSTNLFSSGFRTVATDTPKAMLTCSMRMIGVLV
jgi:hypothetical protein